MWLINEKGPSISKRLIYKSNRQLEYNFGDTFGGPLGGTQSRNNAQLFPLFYRLREKLDFSRSIPLIWLKIGRFTKSRRKYLVHAFHAWKSFHAFTQIFFVFTHSRRKKAYHADLLEEGAPFMYQRTFLEQKARNISQIHKKKLSEEWKNAWKNMKDKGTL